MDLQPIIIGETRPTITAVLDAALQLSKDAHTFSQMPISVEQVSLQPIAVTVLWPGAEGEFAEILITKARLASQRDVPPLMAEGNIFEWIKRVGSFRVVL